MYDDKKFEGNSDYSRDIEFHLHSYTHPNTLSKQGPHIINKGEGIYVFDDTGSAKYTYEYRSNQESEQLIANYGMPGIHTWDDYTTRPNYYSSPRSFKIGLSLDI